MKVSERPSSTKDEQGTLFSYFDTVWVDFDSLPEVKKVKKPAQKRTKKNGNK